MATAPRRADPAAKRTRPRVGLRALPVKLGTPPMEAKLVDDLPDGEGWQFEPKWDGFRCLAYRAGPEVELQSKSGKSLARYFPDVVDALRVLPLDRFVLDGELAILSGGALSFDALHLRLLARRFLSGTRDARSRCTLNRCNRRQPCPNVN